MTRASVTIDGQTYTIGCAPGEEVRLASLALALEDTMKGLRASVGELSGEALAVMAALSVLHRLADAEAANAKLRGRVEALERAREAATLAADQDDEPFVQRLEALADALDALTGSVNQQTHQLVEANRQAGGKVKVAIARSKAKAHPPQTAVADNHADHDLPPEGPTHPATQAETVHDDRAAEEESELPIAPSPV
ncbi:MAG: cell division protein ZapA [Pseudomonadota bacterium]